jgi:hypothetical protein
VIRAGGDCHREPPDALSPVVERYLESEHSQQMGRVVDGKKIYYNFSMYLGLFYVIFSSFNKLQDQNYAKSTRKPKGHKLDTG